MLRILIKKYVVFFFVVACLCAGNNLAHDISHIATEKSAEAQFQINCDTCHLVNTPALSLAPTLFVVPAVCAQSAITARNQAVCGLAHSYLSRAPPKV